MNLTKIANNTSENEKRTPIPPFPLLPHPWTLRRASASGTFPSKTRTRLPTCFCSFAPAAPNTPNPLPPFPLRYSQMKIKRKREKKRHRQLTAGWMEEFKSCSWHGGSVLCCLASSVLASPCLQGKGFCGFRDGADAPTLTRGLVEKKKRLQTSGAVKDRESASSLRHWTFSGLRGKPQFLFQPLEWGYFIKSSFQLI